ncbi:hypothetical protein [Alkalicoccus saliphilus]|uniref:Uncharacterized protein n=1 Tax=Alkalicoccus saliphilus TaxID=200989 RepID=A0A2T4U7N8_9BACI|nr:hypothetical protein [Alkalicoccus saliphilus]PTL39423.1 hypothetical protein C6Y45_06230 [Alkalicoccus saliphilus]
MQENQLTAEAIDEAVNDRVLIIDYDRYLSASSEERLKDVLSEKKLLLIKGISVLNRKQVLYFSSLKLLSWKRSVGSKKGWQLPEGPKLLS